MNSRTTYYALFRAAEELGHYEAARVYLKIAKANGLEMGCFAINKLDMCAEMYRINSISAKEVTLANKPNSEGSFKVSGISSAPVQQATAPNQENEGLLPDAADEKRKQAETEEKLRFAQQLASQNRENERLRAEAVEGERKQVEFVNAQRRGNTSIRERNLSIKWQIETQGKQFSNMWCQVTNITSQGRNSIGEAKFWLTVSCRTSQGSGSYGGYEVFCGAHLPQVVQHSMFTAVCNGS